MGKSLVLKILKKSLVAERARISLFSEYFFLIFFYGGWIPDLVAERTHNMVAVGQEADIKRHGPVSEDPPRHRRPAADAP